MKSLVGLLLISILILAGCTGSKTETLANAPVATEDVVKPFKKEGGQVFRIGVIQSGNYFAYNDVLISIRDGLVDLGWAEKVPLPDKPADPESPFIRDILKAWSGNSAFVEFVPEAFVDLNWTEDVEAPAAMKALLGDASGVDLVISLGTGAGKFVKKLVVAGQVKVPVMVESVSDPIGSGIIVSATDSGSPLVSASFDPDVYDRQIRLFHRVVGFKRLGLIYTDTDTGRAYAALDKVQQAAKDLGFQVIPNTEVLEDPPDPKDIPKAEEAYLAAVRSLGTKVDAIYLAIQAGLTSNSLARVLALAEQYKIPTFIMEGPDFVKMGTMLGESNTVQIIEGLYSAKKLTRILSGVAPNTLPQVNAHMPHIALNLAEARRIGFDIPVDVVLGADEVFASTITSEVAP
jgi:ABC-type uncharacterized transport system substrate-binding protein